MYTAPIKISSENLWNCFAILIQEMYSELESIILTNFVKWLRTKNLFPQIYECNSVS